MSGAHLGNAAKRRLRLASVALLAAAGVALIGARVASAEAPNAVGWWQQALTDLPAGGSLPPAVPDDARPTAVPVPSGGLYVANGPMGPRAVSALRFPAFIGSAVLTLRLSGDPFMPAGARLVACPVAPTWEPIANGRWEARPQVRCDLAAAGAFVDEQSAVRFEIKDLGAYRTARGVEMAIAPAESEVVAFDVAFAAPGRNALAVSTILPAIPTAPPPIEPAFWAAAPPVVSTGGSIGREAPPRVGNDQAGASASTGRPEPAPKPLRIGTDGTARAALAGTLGLLAMAAWITSGGMPRLRRAGAHLEAGR